MRSFLTVVAALTLSGPLAAQAPVITPEGDPSVDDDTIYALAVDPDDHPEEDVVVLLDDGVLTTEADGSGTKTYRTVAQLLTQDAVPSWGERTFSYDAGRQRFRLNWARVVSTDGTVLSDGPIHEQILDMPVPEQSPVYTEWKQVRISLGGVAPGTVVDYSYTIETMDPVMPGEFRSSWVVATGGTIRRSRLVVDVPEDYPLRIDERDLRFEPRVTVVDGRRVHEWSTADLEWIEPEYFADSEASDLFQRVELGGPNEWEDVGAWYADLARDRYTLFPGLRDRLAEVVAEAPTLADSLRALHRWVAQDFRYVSISLGIGGYQPRLPEEVLDTRSGDCKDKATLFIALARELGVEAYPVLLHSTAGVEEELPAVSEFNHMIAAVRTDGDDAYTFLDLTAELIPYGEISPSYQGEMGLVVHDDGSVEEVTFPMSQAEDNLIRVRITGELSEDGTFTGYYEEAARGSRQYGLRSPMAQRRSERELDELARGIGASLFDGGRGDSLQVFDGRDLEADPEVSLRIVAPGAAVSTAGGARVFTLPVSSYAKTSLVSALEEELEDRRFSIDVDQVSGLISETTELRVTLPEGWVAELPPDVTAASDFGSYEATYAQEGRQLTVMRQLVGASGTEPKERLPDLIEWLRAMSADDVRFILLHPEAAPRR